MTDIESDPCLTCSFDDLPLVKNARKLKIDPNESLIAFRTIVAEIGHIEQEMANDQKAMEKAYKIKQSLDENQSISIEDLNRRYKTSFPNDYELACEGVVVTIQQTIFEIVKWIFTLFKKLFNYVRGFLSAAGKIRIRLKYYRYTLNDKPINPGLAEKQKIDIPLFDKIDALSPHVTTYVKMCSEIASCVEGVAKARIPKSPVDLSYFENVIVDCFKTCKSIMDKDIKTLDMLHDTVETNQYGISLGHGWANDWSIHRVTLNTSGWTNKRLMSFLDFADSTIAASVKYSLGFKDRETENKLKTLVGTVTLDDSADGHVSAELIEKIRALTSMYLTTTTALAGMATNVATIADNTARAIRDVSMLDEEEN